MVRYKCSLHTRIRYTYIFMFELHRLGAGSNVQRRLYTGEPSPGRGVQAVTKSWLWHLQNSREEAEAERTRVWSLSYGVALAAVRKVKVGCRSQPFKAASGTGANTSQSGSLSLQPVLGIEPGAPKWFANALSALPWRLSIFISSVFILQ